MTLVITDISILSVCSKILEKPIYNRLKLFTNKHNILTDAQHGFRDNKSNETANQLFIENFQESVDKEIYVLGLFFYLTKAYDVINHEIILTKLEYYGLRGTIKAWLESYRSQFVEIFNTDNRGRNQHTYISLHVWK
jgi:hypothetical protein